MEIRYFEGDDAAFISHIRSLPTEERELTVEGGKYLWKIMQNGEEYILRPQSTKL